MDTMNPMPLRYRISNWEKLKDCKSNISRDYSISVTHIIDTHLSGLKISVKHRKFGTLFCHLIKSQGCLVDNGEYDTPHEFSLDEILKELKKFGFDIEFSPKLKLSTSMIEYLMTIKSLNYEKIRTIRLSDTNLDDTDDKQVYVVAFMPQQLKNWLTNTYMPTKKEFQDALLAGYACSVSRSPEGRHLNWTWLDSVLNIDDVLTEISEN